MKDLDDMLNKAELVYMLGYDYSSVAAICLMNNLEDIDAAIDWILTHYWAKLKI